MKSVIFSRMFFVVLTNNLHGFPMSRFTMDSLGTIIIIFIFRILHRGYESRVIIIIGCFGAIGADKNTCTRVSWYFVGRSVGHTCIFAASMNSILFPVVYIIIKCIAFYPKNSLGILDTRVI